MCLSYSRSLNFIGLITVSERFVSCIENINSLFGVTSVMFLCNDKEKSRKVLNKFLRCLYMSSEQYKSVHRRKIWGLVSETSNMIIYNRSSDILFALA